jgi:hypothetical protein
MKGEEKGKNDVSRGGTTCFVWKGRKEGKRDGQELEWEARGE